MRARFGIVFGLVLAGGGAWAAACSTFSSNADTPDAASDGAPPVDGASDAPADDASPDATPPDIATCPVPAYAPTLPSPDMLPKRTLFVHGPGLAYPQEIAIDEGFVYWVEQTTNAAPFGAARVLRTDRSVGAGEFFVIAAGEPGVTGLALDGPYVYWARPDESAKTTTLVRAPRTCTVCSPEVVASAVPERVRSLRRVAPGVLFGITAEEHLARFDVGVAGGDPSRSTYFSFQFASTSSEAYSANQDSTSIERVDFDFTHAQLFPPVADSGPGYYAGYTGLTTDCAALWGGRRRSSPDGGPALIERIDLDGGARDAATTTGDAGDMLPDHLAVDARYLYIASVVNGLYAHDVVSRVTTHLAGSETIAVAVDDKGIYWGDLSTGNIEMIVKE